MRNFTRMIFAAALVTVASNASSQTSQAVQAGPTKTINIREFAKSLQWEPVTQRPERYPMRRSAPAPDNIRWIDRINNLPDYMKDFYDEYGQKVQEVLDGGTNYLVDNTVGTYRWDDVWENRDLILIKLFTSRLQYTFPTDLDGSSADVERPFAEAVVDQEINRLYDEIDTFFPYMFMSMDYDNPQAFWLGNNYSWCTGWNYSWNYMTAKGKDVVELRYYLFLTVTADEVDYKFDNRITPFNTPEAIKAGVTEFHGIIDDILSNVPQTSRYDQIRYFNDWLTKHNAYCSEYNPNTSYPIVWSPMSALRGTNGPTGPVCEAYSRAFKVLCNKVNIPCVLAVGDAKWSATGEGEAHMWNEVKMNDGQWYAVDVTWNDPMTGFYAVDPKISGYECEDWLLLGKNDVVARNLTFAESHPNSVTFGQNMVDMWDYSCETLIADTHFDPTTQVSPVSGQSNGVSVYSILGVNLGTFNTLKEASSVLEPGFYIINGRKVVIK